MPVRNHTFCGKNNISWLMTTYNTLMRVLDVFKVTLWVLATNLQLTSVFLLGKSHGERSRAGYSPRGCKESDMTEVTDHACMQQIFSLLINVSIFIDEHVEV